MRWRPRFVARIVGSHPARSASSARWREGVLVSIPGGVRDAWSEVLPGDPRPGRSPTGTAPWMVAVASAIMRLASILWSIADPQPASPSPRSRPIPARRGFRPHRHPMTDFMLGRWPHLASGGPGPIVAGECCCSRWPVDRSDRKSAADRKRLARYERTQSSGRSAPAGRLMGGRPRPAARDRPRACSGASCIDPAPVVSPLATVSLIMRRRRAGGFEIAGAVGGKPVA